MLFHDEAPPENRADLCAIAIMAKASRPGRCKTRLAPPLTLEQAARLNTVFLGDISDNIAKAAESAPILGMAAYHPLGEEAFFDTVLPSRFRLIKPREDGIGRSLVHAARDILDTGYGGVCLVNSDSPTLPSHYLANAARWLAQSGDRVVLGPTVDGGYYLIGLKKLHLRLFEDIDWSTEKVFGQTLARAAEIDLEVATLPPWYDVDDSQTLTLLEAELFDKTYQGPFLRGSPAPRSRALLPQILQEQNALKSA